MKNNYEFKKYIKISCIIILLSIIISSIFCYYEYKSYTKNFNKNIENIIEIVLNKYPNVSENEIIEILNENNKSNKNTNILQKYGIDITKDSAISENVSNFKIFIIINSVIMAVSSGVLIFVYLKYNKKKDQDILEIEKYVEQINKGNYKINIDNNSEDELSILKNEVYKVMIMLKESADNSLKDKKTLKSSLEDISHQLKTPLTSIIIAIENLEDSPDLDIETREKFIRIIKKNTANINFLVQSILKLSKFDTNTVEFIKDSVKVKDIIDDALNNTENLCDLKNIKIKIKNNAPNATIYCDKYWQTEAITNIIKNAIEHAERKVTVDVLENNVYLEVSITNDGNEISKKDLPHIFERFYKGENASSDSVGIGLSLSKAIIENGNGKISVNTKKDKETTFVIKYFKN